jgi:hypothetical protein
VRVHIFHPTTERDKSVALSGFLTVIDKLARPAPLNALKTATPRTGKSLLVNVAHILMDGQIATPMTHAEEEETEKRVAGELLADRGLILIDNVGGTLRLNFLNPVLTQKRSKAW